MKDKLISAENELYPGISGHFPLPRVKNCLGDKIMLSDDVVMTTLMWFMTEGRLPQPQKDHWGLAHLRRRWRSHADKPVLQLPVFHHMEHRTCQTGYSSYQSRLVRCLSFVSELREIHWITLLALSNIRDPRSYKHCWTRNDGVPLDWDCRWFSSLLRGFWSGSSGFPPSSKTNISSFQFDLEIMTRRAS